MRLITGVKNPTEELISIYFITLVVGYFADAQYDVFFLLVIASASVAIPVSKVRGIYSVFYSDGLPQLLRSFAMTVIVRWDISLTLNMTYFFYLSSRAQAWRSP